MKNIKNSRYEEITPDLFNIKNLNMNKNTSNTGITTFPNNKNIQLDPLKKNMNHNSSNNNSNVFVINRKEAKRYEELLRNSHHNMNYEVPNTINNNLANNNNVNNIPNIPLNKVKAGKVILDPINSNPFNQNKKNFHPNINSHNAHGSNKKMEVSFKATLQFTDNSGLNNKIEISPNINLHNVNVQNVQNAKKMRLEKIPEREFNNELEFEEQ